MVLSALTSPIGRRVFRVGKYVIYPVAFGLGMIGAVVVQGSGKVKHVSITVWHAKHMMVHLGIGVAWAWILREIWGELNGWWVFLALFGSWLPDVDHFFYYFTYGKHDVYSKEIKDLLLSFKWSTMVKRMESGHKQVTSLMTHNIFIMVALLIFGIILFLFDRRSSTALIGAMVWHYLYDIVDDILILGRINPNWKRFGRKKA